jgi:glycerol uptake facilitator-like aquaporin
VVHPALARRATAEAVGTGMLVAVVVGSGIAADRFTDDAALALLANAAATAGGLAALILAFSAVSGAHINPVVSLADRVAGRSTGREAAAYVAAQVAGAVVGVVVTNLMFDLAPVTLSTQARSSAALWLGEVVATFGLLTVIRGLVRSDRSSAVPYAVAGYIAAAYWFTSSTSFADPAVTIGRTLTDTFTGIAPSSAPPFIVAQLIGGAIAVALARSLYGAPRALTTADRHRDAA